MPFEAIFFPELRDVLHSQSEVLLRGVIMSTAYHCASMVVREAI